MIEGERKKERKKLPMNEFVNLNYYSTIKQGNVIVSVALYQL